MVLTGYRPTIASPDSALTIAAELWAGRSAPRNRLVRKASPPGRGRLEPACSAARR